MHLRSQKVCPWTPQLGRNSSIAIAFTLQNEHPKVASPAVCVARVICMVVGSWPVHNASTMHSYHRLFIASGSGRRAPSLGRFPIDTANLVVGITQTIQEQDQRGSYKHRPECASMISDVCPCLPQDQILEDCKVRSVVGVKYTPRARACRSSPSGGGRWCAATPAWPRAWKHRTSCNLHDQTESDCEPAIYKERQGIAANRRASLS